MLKANQGYVIGVDGGGFKTTVALADLRGRILTRYRVDSSSPRNIGIKSAIKNLAGAISKALVKAGSDKKILATFLGLPAMEEEFKSKKNVIKKELLRHRKIQSIFKGKVIIDSDQLAGFRSGTDKKEGVVLIGGSGCAAHGWRGNREVKVDAWGYLSEMGSAFWAGQKALQAVWKELDGRGSKTLITKMVFREWRVKNKENLIEKIYYKNPFQVIISLSVLADKASKKGDRVGKNIMEEAGKELALSANTAIRKLNFQKFKFPLVLIGSMFKSKIALGAAKREIKKNAPRTEFIRPKVEPVIGAIRLALEALDNKND